METLKEGTLTNRFVGKMVGCVKCNGYFRLTEHDEPHEMFYDRSKRWTVRTTVQQKIWYYITCPTDGCRAQIEFTV